LHKFITSYQFPAQFYLRPVIDWSERNRRFSSWIWRGVMWGLNSLISSIPGLSRFSHTTELPTFKLKSGMTLNPQGNTERALRHVQEVDPVWLGQQRRRIQASDQTMASGALGELRV
jgi:hypothetical protein